MAQRIRKQLFRVLPLSLVGLLVLVLIVSSWQIFPIEVANAAASNVATFTNVTPGMQYTSFMGVPVYRLHVANSGDAEDTIKELTPTPIGNVDDTTITLHFYQDANNNGFVDQGDTDLEAPAAFSSDNTKQTFNITDVPVPAGGSASILITADGFTVGDAQIFRLSMALGTDILMDTVAINNTGDFPLMNTDPLTASDTAPSLSITNGANDPAPKTATTSETGVVVKQISITAAATSDSIVSLAITPAGTENDATQVLATKFYIDSGTTPGVVDVSDILLAKTLAAPTTYSADNTKTVFTFLSPIQIATATTVNILYTYDLGAGVVNGNTLTARLVATTDAVAGSVIEVSSNSSTVSSTVTISVPDPIKVTVTREVGGVDSGFTVEVRCTGGAYNQLTGNPTTDAGGIVSAEPVVGSSCGTGDSIDVRVTKEGYVIKETLAAGTYLATNPAADISITGVQYAYKITYIVTEVGGYGGIVSSVSALTVGDDTGHDTCVFSGGAWYCPVVLANSDGTIVGKPTKDGFVEADYALSGVTTRTANSDAQVSTGIAGGAPGVKFAYKITSVTTEVLGADITGSIPGGGMAVGDDTSLDSCLLQLGVWYCPTLLADSDGALVGVVYKDGYVQENHNLVTGTGRSANTDPQLTDTIIDVKYAYKITSIPAEATGDELKTSVTAVNAGDAQGTTCAKGGDNNWYCAVLLADTTLAIQVTQDGYVQDTTSFNFTSDRTSDTDPQWTATSGAVKYAYKITSITTEGLGADITAAVTGLLVGDFGGSDPCTLNTGVWYCPILLADSAGAIKGRPTLDGYFQEVIAAAGASSRIADTDAQQVGSILDVKYGQKVIVTDSLAAAPFSGATVTAGFLLTACTESGVSGIYYCAVPIATDGALHDISIAKFGYTTNTTAGTTNRVSATSAQGVASVVMDTTPPTVVSVTPAPTLLAEVNVGLGTFNIVVVYDETMDATGANDPTLDIHNPPQGSLSFVSGIWSTTNVLTPNDTYTATYNFSNMDETISNIDIDVSGAEDLDGNVQTAYNSVDVLDIDTHKPTITAVQEFDVDADGQIDETVLTFSEAIIDATVTVSDFAIGGTAADTIVVFPTNGSDPNTTDDNIITIEKSGGIAGTEAKAVVYTAGSVTDSAGNSLDTVTIAVGSVTDSALPIILAVREFDVNQDGKIDETMITFSEAISETSVTASEFTIGGTTADTFLTIISTNGFDPNVADDNVITIEVAAGVAGTEAKELVYSHVMSLTDIPGNELANVTILAGNVTDNASPVIVSTTPVSGAVGVTITSGVVVNFSEPMNTGTVTHTSVADPGGWSVDWNPGNDTAHYFHTAFANSTSYTQRITAGDDPTGNSISASLVPNPWIFTTIASAVVVGGGGYYTPPDTAPPANTSISINSGITDTASQSVTLTLGATDAVQMMISNNADFSGASWETYTISKSWILTSGTGIKTVYAKFKDTAGNASTLVSDTINSTATTDILADNTSGLILQDPVPAPALPPQVTIGTLVKLADNGSVYFIDQDNRRHAFPNEAVYLSYYPDFSGIQTISSSIMAEIPLGSNVTMRPGTYLVKIQSDPKVYAVAPYGVLKGIGSEAIAVSLYGADWATRVVDVEPTFFINYQIGSAITTATLPTGSAFSYQGDSKVYYVDGGNKRYVSSAVFNSNKFQNKFVIRNLATSNTYPDGADLPSQGMEVIMTLR